MKRLTDSKIRSLKPKTSRYDFNAGDGFVIRIYPSGTKTWQYVYRFEGRLRRLTLGHYPLMTLQQARLAHADAAAQRHNELDPASSAVIEKQQQREAPTIEELAASYIEQHAKRHKRSWKEDQRMLEKDVIPQWRNQKAKDITRKQVANLLEKIIERGAPVTANRTFEIIRRMFNFAIEREILTTSPCIQLKAPTPKISRDRVLSQVEIHKFWERLPAAAMSEPLRIALKFQLVTAQRRGEIICARWQDIEEGWWTIPAAVSKNKLPHRVPLSTLALQLLDELAEYSGDSEYLFPNPSRSDHVTTRAPTRALARVLPSLKIDHFTPHDLRRTAASQMASISIEPTVIGKILNHTQSGVIAVYIRHSYDKEKQEALSRWSDHLAAMTQRGSPDDK